MRLSVSAVIFLVIFINSVEQRVALEDENPDDYDENYKDEAELGNTEIWEENINAVTLSTDESNLKGNESLEETNATTIRYSSPKKDESEAQKPQILDPDECGDPPPIKHSMIFEGKQDRYEIGSKVTYACDFGYITDGSVHFSECFLSDATQTLNWTDPEIRCSPRSCGEPGYVENAHRVGSVFTFPNKVSFECDDGFTIRGYGTRYCQTSGTWTGNLPTCEPIFCDPPENPVNGKVSYSSLRYESELRYECDPGFILKNDQGRICSANGTWSGNEPICLEAQCDPPVAPEHGTVQVIGDKSSVGSRALYTCDEGRVLVGSASSKCLDIGEWTFPTPRCLEPCFVPKIEHGKIGKYVGYYRRRKFEELSENSKIDDGEELYLRCEPDYEPFGRPETEEKITCSYGEWKEVPVCKPAMCRRPPPPTANADVARANRTHGGGVVYLCRQYAKKVKYGSTTCVFGTWKGDRPVCKDLRCSVDELSFPGLIKGTKKFFSPNELFTVICERGFNLTKENNQLKCMNGEWKGQLPPCLEASCNAEDLVESQGIVPDRVKIVLNGENLKVRCREGYSPSENSARCYRGQWDVAGNLCVESSCTVYRIDNGGFTQKVQKRKWKYWGYEKWDEYERLSLGEKRSPGSWIYVSCDAGYSFQGKRDNNVSVKCSKGKWDPDSVCLITGTPYRQEARLPLEKAEKTNISTNTQTDRIPSTTRQPLALATQGRPSAPDAVLDLNKNPDPTPYPSCTCAYQSVDDSLLAFVGTEQLSYNSRVKQNSKIKFLCRHFGYSRLNGPSEIECKNCQPWHSSELPGCVPPRIGDTILQFEGDFTILPGGILEIAEGKQLSIKCSSGGIADFPMWGTNLQKQLLFSSYIDQSRHYISALTISNADSQHSGRYYCFMKGYQPFTFDIQVISQQPLKSVTVCPIFDDRDYIIHYDKGQAVNSSAIFSCRDKGKKLNGLHVVICLLNGQWSGDPPECKTICPLIEETGGVSISYTNGVEVGSIAAFHCLEPRIRTGVPWTTCKENGEWADPPSNCTFSSCPLDLLFDVVPENVIPVMENVASGSLPYNSTLHLTCENGMMISGSDVARCGQDGKWNVSRVQCVSGCGLTKMENSELIIEPDQRFYRFGESVALSCSPGYVLNPEVVRLMCLGTSWSENVPECLKQ